MGKISDLTPHSKLISCHIKLYERNFIFFSETELQIKNPKLFNYNHGCVDFPFLKDFFITFERQKVIQAAYSIK